MTLKHFINKLVVVQTRDEKIYTGKLVSENDFIVLESANERIAINKKDIVKIKEYIPLAPR